MHAPLYTESEARAITAAGIREGRIRVDLPCCICGVAQHRMRSGVLAVVQHHPALRNHPSWVLPVCRRDHMLIHGSKIPDPGSGRYWPVTPPPEPGSIVSAYPESHEERQWVVLSRLPSGEHRSARQIAKELDWGLGVVHESLRELRLAGIVDSPNPSLGFVRVDRAA
jgi:hypothetical protein